MTMHICNLTQDYRDVTSYYSRLFVDKQREAPCFFKSGDCFMLATSGCTGWEPNKLELFWSRCATDCYISLELHAFSFIFILLFPLYNFLSICWYACAQHPHHEVVSVGNCHACMAAVVKEASCGSMAAPVALCLTLMFCGRSAHT